MGYKNQKQYRLPGFDYSGEGEYFITICVDGRKHHLGKIMHGKMILSEIGKIVDQIWNEIPNKFENVRLNEYQVMPDHFHGIRNNPMELKSITLGRIVRWFKGRVKFDVKKINPDFKWQSRFHDRLIRDENEFYFISEYIINNPINWGESILKRYFES